MVGSATFTTVTSRTIISIPTHSTYSAIQRRRSLAGFATPRSAFATCCSIPMSSFVVVIYSKDPRSAAD
jgi:hypothetical protein